jgi:hypothetical protein
LVAKSGAPNFVIITGRRSVFLHLVGFQEWHRRPKVSISGGDISIGFLNLAESPVRSIAQNHRGRPIRKGWCRESFVYGIRPPCQEVFLPV